MRRQCHKPTVFLLLTRGTKAVVGEGYPRMKHHERKIRSCDCFVGTTEQISRLMAQWFQQGARNCDFQTNRQFPLYYIPQPAEILLKVRSKSGRDRARILASYIFIFRLPFRRISRQEVFSLPVVNFDLQKNSFLRNIMNAVVEDFIMYLYSACSQRSRMFR